MKKLIITLALLLTASTLSYAQLGMMMKKSKPIVPFISTWETTVTNETITLPLLSSGGQYDFVVDWGDGTTERITTNSASHSYAVAGTQTIRIKGLINGWRFNNGGDKAKITDISQWGCLKGAGESAFRGCYKLNVSATDPLNTEGITNFSFQFYGCSNLTTLDMSGWDVSSGTNFSYQFTDCTSLTNLDVSNWDVSSGTNFSYQFNNCVNLTTLDVSNWDVSSGTNFLIFMLGTSMSTANYNATLINWSAFTLKSGVIIHFGNSKYSAAPSAAATARSAIQGQGWTITDGGGI